MHRVQPADEHSPTATAGATHPDGQEHASAAKPLDIVDVSTPFGSAAMFPGLTDPRAAEGGNWRSRRRPRWRSLVDRATGLGDDEDVVEAVEVEVLAPPRSRFEPARNHPSVSQRCEHSIPLRTRHPPRRKFDPWQCCQTFSQ
jgi:hypothetical protein